MSCLSVAALRASVTAFSMSPLSLIGQTTVGVVLSVSAQDCICQTLFLGMLCQLVGLSLRSRLKYQELLD